jgi:hypothetical protein
MKDEMTSTEKRDGAALIKDIQQLIEDIDPALASWALISVLASLVAARAEDPAAQARHLGERLVETVKTPPLPRFTN